MKPFIADLHTHTIMSGHAFGTIREMAADAAAKKILLLGTTDHAPGIPGCCDPIYFRNLVDAPRNLYGVELLHGSEVNIYTDGQLSLDQRHLDCLDYAIVGIHGHCYENQGIVKNTDYLCDCMRNPKVRIISHPDDNRYPLDYRELVLAAKDTHTALELNNSSLRHPQLRPGCIENYMAMLPLCMEYSVCIAVNSDAHDPSAVGNFSAARKLLEQISFDDNLILNTDLHLAKSFLL